MLATVVDTEALLDTVLAAFAGGLGVALAFSLAVLGAARFADLSRDGRQGAAAMFGLLSILALLVVAGAIVIGLVVMTSK